MAADNFLSLVMSIAMDPTAAEEKLAGFAALHQRQVQQMVGDTTTLKTAQEGLAASFASIVTIGTSALIALGGALVGAAEKSAHFAEEIDHVSQRSGATLEQVSAMRFAANLAGVSFDRVAQGLTFLARNLGNIDAPGNRAAKALSDLGISATDAHGRHLPLSALLPVILQRLGSMEAGSRRTADAMGLFGRGAGALIPILSEFRNGMNPVIEQARSMGLVVDETSLIMSEKFLITQRLVKEELESLAITIGQKVMPQLTELLANVAAAPEYWTLLVDRLASVSHAFAALGAIVIGAFAAIGASLEGKPGVALQYMREALKGMTEEWQKATDAANKSAEDSIKVDATVSALEGKIRAMTAAMIAHGVATGDTTGKVKEHKDAIQNLISTLQDEALALEIGDNKRRQAFKTYEDEIRKIDEAAASEIRAGTFTQTKAEEVAQAKRLAYSNYVERFGQLLDEEVKKSQEHYDEMLTQKAEFDTKLLKSWEDIPKRTAEAMAGVGKLIGIDPGQEQELVNEIDKTTGLIQAHVRPWKETLANALNLTEPTTEFILKAQQMGLGADKLRQDFLRVFAADLPSAYRLSEHALNEWESQTHQVFTRSQVMIGTFVAIASNYLHQYGAAFITSGINAIASGENIAKALLQMLSSTLANLSGIAVMRVFEENAKAASDHAMAAEAAAEYDFVAAALWEAAADMHHGAAITWGLVAGGAAAGAIGAGVAARAVGGGAGGAARSSATAPASSGTVSAPTPGSVPMASGFVGATSQPSGKLTVMIVGDQSAGAWVAGVLNNHVEKYDGKLVSSSTKRSPYAGR
jgi:hypothetical protein